MATVTKKEFDAYKKKHMKFHHQEEAMDERKDKKIVKVAIRKTRLKGKK
jgi:hypothetical protein